MTTTTIIERVKDLRERQEHALDSRDMFAYLDVKIDLAAAFPAIAEALLIAVPLLEKWEAECRLTKEKSGLAFKEELHRETIEALFRIQSL